MEKTRITHMRTLDIVYIALFAALTAVCAWISVPMPAPLVPFTLQTFAIFLILLVLGGQRGLYAVIVYLLLGAVGLPVFSGFKGGFGVLLGTTGGYILGFVASALVYWFITAAAEKTIFYEKFGKKAEHIAQIIGCILGLLVCYIFGTIWFMIVYTSSKGAIGVWTALGWCVFPFIIPDLAKLFLALALSQQIAKALK